VVDRACLQVVACPVRVPSGSSRVIGAPSSRKLRPHFFLSGDSTRMVAVSPRLQYITGVVKVFLSVSRCR